MGQSLVVERCARLSCLLCAGLPDAAQNVAQRMGGGAQIARGETAQDRRRGRFTQDHFRRKKPRDRELQTTLSFRSDQRVEQQDARDGEKRGQVADPAGTRRKLSRTAAACRWATGAAFASVLGFLAPADAMSPRIPQSPVPSPVPNAAEPETLLVQTLLAIRNNQLDVALT